MYKLYGKEQRVIMSLLETAKARKQMLQTLIKQGTGTLTTSEFEADLTTLRSPIIHKEFSSTFLDNVLKDRLDTMNPLKFLDNHETNVTVENYILMIDLNIRILKDLEIKSIKGEEVS